MIKRAVIYARVSVDDVKKGKKTADELKEEGSQSILGQVAAAKKIVESNEYNLIEAALVDDGISGFKGKERAGFNRLMSLIASNSVDVVVTRAVDRIGRNDTDNSAIRIGAATQKVVFHLINGEVVDPSQSGQKLLMQMTQGLSEFQSATKRETLKNHYEGVRNAGKLRNTRKTFGWQWEKGNPKVSMKADEFEKAVITRTYAALLRDDPEKPPAKLYGVIQAWNADPRIKTVGKAERWSYASVRAVLLRPSNARLISDGKGWLTGVDDDGKPLRGIWDALVSEEDYLALRNILTSPSRRTSPGKKVQHLGSGIIRCGVCGEVLRSSSVGNRGDRTPIYRCTRKLAFSADKGTRHVSARVSEIHSTMVDAVVQALVFGPTNMFPEQKQNASDDLHSKLDSVIGRKREFAQSIDDETYTLAEVRPWVKKLNKEEAELRELLEEADANDARLHSLPDLRKGLFAPGRVDLAKVAEISTEIRKSFLSRELEEQRALVRYLIDVTVLPVAPGRRGAARWDVVHKVVLSLNDPAEAHVELDDATMRGNMPSKPLG